nr:hypothetical protein GCM10020063_020540 [Dactylosporangium thailandense]
MLEEMAAGWSAGFVAFLGRFAGLFPRVESRRQMRIYVRGLLGEVERKNGWTLAEAAGDVGPERMQRLLNFYAWDTDGVRDEVRAAVVEAIGDAQRGVLVVDETGFLKKGVKSAGVARQYTGTAGRIENAQVGVFLAYASPRGRALIDRELYLPKEWTDDRQRCRDAGVPDVVRFATKPLLAQEMVERALEAQVPFGWLTGDEAYGQDTKLRMWLELNDIAHVLAVPCNAMVVSQRLLKERVDRLVAAVEAGEWVRLSCGAGAHGERVYDWAAGLDHYQVRGYEPWYRHITLSMLAAAFLVITRDAVKKGDPLTSVANL